MTFLYRIVRTRARARTGTYGPSRAPFVPGPGQAFRAPPAPAETIGMSIPHRPAGIQP